MREAETSTIRTTHNPLIRLFIGAMCLWVLGCGQDAVVGGAKPSGQDAMPGSDSKAGGDTKPATGIGLTCASNAVCAPFGLNCFETSSATGEGICTRTCAGGADCPVGSHCNPVGPALVCTEGRYCNPCASDGDCGALAPLCKPDKDGKGFCTHACNIGDGTCGAAASCVQFGTSLQDFACRPDYGACTGGGEHCSPCATQADCGVATECFTATQTGERFCAQTCDPTQSGGCPSGFGCQAAKGKGYCFKQTSDGLVPTCAKGDKGFCDSCTANYECASNRCANHNDKKFCVEPAPCDKQNESTDCPYGGVDGATQCVPTDVGMACAPPPAWGCQGFKLCLGHPCTASQVCTNGLCKPK